MQRKQVWRKVASREIKADTKICRSADKMWKWMTGKKEKKEPYKNLRKRKCNRAAVELAGWCKSVKVRKVQQKWMGTATVSEWSPCNIYFPWLLQATGEPGPPLPTQQESFGYNTSNNGGKMYAPLAGLAKQQKALGRRWWKCSQGPVRLYGQSWKHWRESTDKVGMQVHCQRLKTSFADFCWF